MSNYKTSNVTKGRRTKGRKLQNLEKGRKLQEAEKGGKIRYNMGKIGGKISPPNPNPSLT
jgi:hypothetical protein